MASRRGNTQMWELEDRARKSLIIEGVGLSRLAQMSLKAACESQESVQAWRKQVRTLERLPSHLAHPLFHRLLHNGLLSAPLLEAFQYSMEEIVLSGEASVDAEWTAYLRSFHCLRVLEVANCRSMSNFAILQLKGLEALEELNMSYCSKITDEALFYLVGLTNLKNLSLSGTRVTSEGMAKLAALKALTYLDLGGLPVTDSTLFSLSTLSCLQELVLWGSGVSDDGVLCLTAFPRLQHLNMAWTGVTRIPPLYSLRHLNMANCTISSIFSGWEGSEGQLEELHISGSNIIASSEILAAQWANNLSVLDVSSCDLKDFEVLGRLRKLKRLDLGGTMAPYSVIHAIAKTGGALQELDLSGCKVTSEAVGILAGSLSNLQQLVLSGTLVDDSVFAVLQLMPALRMIDLSYTNVKGYAAEENGKASKISSFAAIQQLPSLTVLNLRNTSISDKSCQGLSCLSGLMQLHLRSELLSDSSLQYLSGLKSLVILSIEGAMLTDSGLLSFISPPLLVELSLLDCWLLTKKGLLQFSKAHKELRVRHVLVPGALRGTPVKDSPSKGDTYAKGTKSATSRSPARQKAHSMDQREMENLAFLSDERIRFTRAELLDLRLTWRNYQGQLGVCVSELPPSLSNMDDLAGLFKILNV